uniref:Uncharacterized protein n=1 Tax=Amphimedon queenslandica TaxID=400682 RepID=A0A1X7UKK2_AMPQE
IERESPLVPTSGEGISTLLKDGLAALD